MMENASGAEIEDVLRFWFPERLTDTDHAMMVRQFEWWFRGGADSAIIERFQLLLEQAAGGERDHWAHNPRSRLALIIVLDQFSRSIHRGTARAYAQDPKALALALEGIAIGHYAALETPFGLREEDDREAPGLATSAVIANAPRAHGSFVAVPRVLAGDD